jgi:hypothetical protein
MSIPRESLFQHPARPNVLIELGMALRTHAERVVLIEFPPIRRISDIAGLVTLRFDGDERKFAEELKKRLRQAGCEVPQTADAAIPAGMLSASLKQRRMAPLRFLGPRIGAAVASAALAVAVGWFWVAPNWCGQTCREANQRYASGTALWLQANANAQYADLYQTALDEYYKALGYDQGIRPTVRVSRRR